MKYDVFGPFKLPRSNNGLFSRVASEKKAFWSSLDKVEQGLSEACGCYLISARNRVWYVGLAEKQTFRRECFAPHKVTKIDDAIASAKGDAYLLLLARKTPQDRFMKPSKNGIKDAEQMELLLIGAALERNDDLLNKQATKIVREAVVPGFLNSPKGCGNDARVRRFRQIMGI